MRTILLVLLLAGILGLAFFSGTDYTDKLTRRGEYEKIEEKK